MHWQKLQFLPYDFGERAYGGFVPLVIGPLTDAPDFNQARSLQRCKIIRHRRLGQSDPFLDTADADADRKDVTLILRREVFRRLLQTSQDFKARAV